MKIRTIITLLLLLMVYADVRAQLPQLDMDRNTRLFGYKKKRDPNEPFFITAQYERATPFQALPGSITVAAVRMNGLWGFINEKGEYIIKIQYEGVGSFHNCDIGEYVVRVKKNGKWGFVKTDGTEAIAFQYDSVMQFDKTLKGYLTPACIEHKWGFINKKNEMTVPAQFEDANRFQLTGNGNRAAVKQNGRWGFIDEYNKAIIPCVYDTVQSFSEELAAVKKDGKWVFLNGKGEPATPFQYDAVDVYRRWYKDYTEARAIVVVNNRPFYITKDGKEVEAENNDQKEHLQLVYRTILSRK